MDRNTLDESTGIKNPIFIIGSGRSGTTIFYSLLMKLDQTTGFQNWENYLPVVTQKETLHRYFRQMASSGLLQRIDSRIFNTKLFFPSKESNRIFNLIGLNRLPLPLEGEQDPIPGLKLKAIIDNCVGVDNQAFTLKNTNNGLRINYLKAFFPQAAFLHIIRDGRANIASYLKTDFFYKMRFWWAENKTYPEIISEFGSAVELAAVHWRSNLEEIISQSQMIPSDQYLEIKYENLIERPVEIIHDVAEFCGLKMTESDYIIIRKETLENRNYKWKLNLSNEEVDLITHEIKPLLERFGYEC